MAKTSILVNYKPVVPAFLLEQKKNPACTGLNVHMGRLTRLELASAGATIQSVNQLHHNRHVLNDFNLFTSQCK